MRPPFAVLARRVALALAIVLGGSALVAGPPELAAEDCEYCHDLRHIRPGSTFCQGSVCNTTYQQCCLPGV